MRIYNNNISSLFGNNEKASMYSEFANKKTGSYRRLLKQYYSDVKKDELAQKKSNKDTDKIKNELYSSAGVTADKTLANMKKESDALKTATDALNNDELWKQNNGEYNVDGIASAVKSFVTEYNDVIKQSSKVSSSGVSSNVNYMKNMTNAMSKSLAKSGITVSVDGKLSLDEEALKSTDIKDVKALFSGKTTYGAQIGQNAANISKSTVTDSSLYGRNGSYGSSISSIFNQNI